MESPGEEIRKPRFIPGGTFELEALDHIRQLERRLQARRIAVPGALCSCKPDEARKPAQGGWTAQDQFAGRIANRGGACAYLLSAAR